MTDSADQAALESEHDLLRAQIGRLQDRLEATYAEKLALEKQLSNERRLIRTLTEPGPTPRNPLRRAWARLRNRQEITNLKQALRRARRQHEKTTKRWKAQRHRASMLTHKAQAALLGGGADPLILRTESQLGQDIWVLARTKGLKGGFFVEFGADDGVLNSNSWLLETEYGWQGICAEPNPDAFAKLRENRSCQVSDACIAGTSGDRVSFVLAGQLGTIAEYAETDMHSATRKKAGDKGQVIDLDTVSLHDFLIAQDAPQRIDYLSIDTEGSEYDILRTFPFDRWQIGLISVEHNFTPAREQIRALLEANGYRLAGEQNVDDWYERIADYPEPVGAA